MERRRAGAWIASDLAEACFAGGPGGFLGRIALATPQRSPTEQGGPTTSSDIRCWRSACRVDQQQATPASCSRVSRQNLPGAVGRLRTRTSQTSLHGAAQSQPSELRALVYADVEFGPSWLGHAIKSTKKLPTLHLAYRSQSMQPSDKSWLVLKQKISNTLIGWIVRVHYQKEKPDSREMWRTL